jgi:hypothetical protein
MSTETITRTPPRTEAEIITYGWKVFRAAQDTEWPEEHRFEIYRAFVKLSTELQMHGRLADDAWAAEAAPKARVGHAKAAMERAAEVTGLLERYCAPVAATTEGGASA